EVAAALRVVLVIEELHPVVDAGAVFSIDPKCDVELATVVIYGLAADDGRRKPLYPDRVGGGLSVKCRAESVDDANIRRRARRRDRIAEEYVTFAHLKHFARW